MQTLPSLIEARAAKADALRSIISNAETEKRDLTDTEQSAFDATKAEVEKLEKQIHNAEYVRALESRMEGTPVASGERGERNFRRESRKYSLVKAIAHQCGMRVDAGRELEISQELERRSGLKAEGMLAPTNVFEQRVDVITTGLPATGPGSNIIATDYLSGEYIDILREAMAVQRLGARVLNGLVGNVAMPRLKASATAYWVAENSAITASDAQFEQVTMTPKHIGARLEVSRNMLQQATPDIEGIVRGDFAALLARGVDRVAINGGGSNEPTGILQTTDVIDVPGGAAGLAPTWANILLCIAGVAGANALQGNLGFLTNSKVTAKCSTVLKSAADTSSNFILESPGSTTLAGYPLVMSNLVPSTLAKSGSGNVCSALIFGNFSDLLIGYWSAFDLLANPYDSTAYPKGNVLIRAMATCDVAVRQPKSFAKIADILTT